MIEELSVQFPAKECCVALSVSRSGYYFDYVILNRLCALRLA
jgi:hypothetical protein